MASFWALVAAWKARTTVERLRKIEARLLEYAHAYRHDEDKLQEEYSGLNIEVQDTFITRNYQTDAASSETNGGSHHLVQCQQQDDRLFPHGSHHRIHGVKAQMVLKDDVDSIHGSRNHAYRRSKTPLVLLHGYMNGGGYFYRNLAGLAPYFSAVFALDWLGWGLSSRPTFRANTRQAAEDFFVHSLEAWRQAQGLDKMILAGHSIGGYLSVAYTERYPQHVERLILLSPAGVPDPNHDVNRQYQTLAQTPLETSSVAIRSPQRRQPLYPLSPMASLDSITTSLLLGSLASYFDELDSLAKSWKRNALAAIYSMVYHRFTLGDVLRLLPVADGLRRTRAYTRRRFQSWPNDKHEERETLAEYLYYSNTLPGTADYCLPLFLTPMVIYGRSPTVHRIPLLNVDNVSFLYGEADWMDPVAGGLRVQSMCQQRSARGEPTPNVRVFVVSHAAHLLMLDNWQQFNTGILRAAGLEEGLADEPLPYKSRLHYFVKHEDPLEGHTQTRTPKDVNAHGGPRELFSNRHGRNDRMYSSEAQDCPPLIARVRRIQLDHTG